ncbi:hypothetical protein ATI61_114224 [Archangium gephyra]|uniref:Lipoprotein n=1 Tax=Archangium gephyra TaxID=48 RepID=A0AAC8TCJ7_9BACT|nr:hypothetical protein [Archangium gephyra]AKJ01067.1 Hypothetical protein AA314_02693 [Archangium gephyra]REG24615.1 hypothetical protein ATI61_114224 [Archangium gephyra]
MSQNPQVGAVARGVLLAAWMTGALAHAHQTPPGDVYPNVTRSDQGFVVTYRSSIDGRSFSQPYGLDGKPSTEAQVIPASKAPPSFRTANRWPRVPGMSAETEQAVLRRVFLGYGTSTAIVSDGANVEWIHIYRGEALRCHLRIASLEQRCAAFGRILDGPMGIELIAEPLQQGSERGVFWINEYYQLVFSTWTPYSYGPVRTRLVWNEFGPETSLSSAVNGDVALVAAHVPNQKGLFQIQTWTVRWPARPGTPGK